MSPITHFLVSWVGCERFHATPRDKALVVLSGLIPDLDGLGIIFDFITRVLGLPETDLYQTYHRTVTHNLLAVIIFSVLAATLAHQRIWVGAWIFLCMHLHLLCDIIGARGSDPEDIWGIYYLVPFDSAWELRWSGQWPLIGWQNMLISASLLAILLWQTAQRGYSPLMWAGTQIDAVFVATLRKWQIKVLHRY
jgi:inner membrane protein